MGPLVLLRCDAVPAGGIGHLVRCLAVAEAARAAGWRCLLVGEVTAPLAREMVAQAGVQVRAAGPEPLDALARELGAAVVHVDTYDDLRCDVGAPSAGVVVSAVQDGRYGRRDAHVVVDASAAGDVTAAVLPSPLVRLTGPREALVREQVRVAARRRAGRSPAARVPAARVLVVAGGTDAAGVVPRLTALVLAATTDLRVGGAPVEVVALDPAAGQASTEGRLVRRRPGPDLVELAADATLVVTASGTTTSELAVLGVPMAVVQVVPNQAETYDRLVSAGAALGLGTAAELAPDAARQVRDLLGDPDRSATLADAAARMVDGAAAARTVAAWTAVAAGSSAPDQRGWWVTPAQASDGGLLLDWRNDPETRRRSLSSTAVPAAEHEAWLTRVLADSGRELLLVGHGADPVGTVRFDSGPAGDREVSITLAPQQRGRGRAATVLACGEEYLAARLPGTCRLTARVKVDNAASGALFRRAGYRLDDAASAADPGVEHWEKALAPAVHPAQDPGPGSPAPTVSSPAGSPPGR